MRIGVVLYGLDPSISPPAHFVSQIIAGLLCADVRYGQRTRTPVRTAERVSRKLIRLLTAEPWPEIKRRIARPTGPARVFVPRMLPPDPVQPANLDLNYPERWFTTPCLRHPHEAFKLGRTAAADLLPFPCPVPSLPSVVPPLPLLPLIHESEAAQTTQAAQ